MTEPIQKTISFKEFKKPTPMQKQEPPKKPKYVSVLIKEKDGHTYWAVIKEDHRFFATQEESDQLAQNLNTLAKITGE